MLCLWKLGPITPGFRPKAFVPILTAMHFLSGGFVAACAVVRRTFSQRHERIKLPPPLRFGPPLPLWFYLRRVRVQNQLLTSGGSLCVRGSRTLAFFFAGEIVSITSSQILWGGVCLTSPASPCPSLAVSHSCPEQQATYFEEDHRAKGTSWPTRNIR